MKNIRNIKVVVQNERAIFEKKIATIFCEEVERMCGLHIPLVTVQDALSIGFYTKESVAKFRPDAVLTYPELYQSEKEGFVIVGNADDIIWWENDGGH